ncbi:hypothetical protein V8E52_010102 [Russula decolorans]
MSLMDDGCTYHDFCVYIARLALAADLDPEIHWSRQDVNKIACVCTMARKKYNFLKRYIRDWPIKEYLKQHFANQRNYKHRTRRIKDAAAAQGKNKGIPQVYIYLEFVQFQLQFHFDKAHSAHNEVHVLLGSMQQISIRTTCKAPDRQLSFVTQVYSSSLSLIPSLEHLYICKGIYSRSHWQDNIENNQWLELLHPFTTVKNLYLSKGVVPRIALTL